MLSRALQHYPQYVFRDKVKKLWNPILRKAFVNRPEERVRLQLIEFFLNETEALASRISFESPINLPGGRADSRTDILVYNHDFEPLLLVECKAPEVTLNQKTALQIARYNTKVKAPYLLISNGLHDFWFEVKQNRTTLLPNIPDPFKSVRQPERDFKYWTKRGFAGTGSHPETRKWIRENCELLYLAARPGEVKYLSFDESQPDLALSNYYYLYRHDDDRKLAISLGSTPYEATRLNIVFNINGKNESLLSCSLDLTASNESENAVLMSQAGTEYLDFAAVSDFSFEKKLPELLPDLFPAFYE